MGAGNVLAPIVPMKSLSRALVGAVALVVIAAPTLLPGTALPAALAARAAAPTREEAAPDFTLTNQDGRRITLRQFRGKIVLMNFIYTHCTDICPLAEAKLAKVQDELKTRGWFGTRVVFISMTFDPGRDTPAVMKAYSKRFRADLTGWQFLTGPPPAVNSVLKAYKIPVRAVPKTGLFEHALPMLVIDQHGVMLGHYEPDFTPASVIRDLTKLLGN